jgi:hypothetical protein
MRTSATNPATDRTATATADNMGLGASCHSSATFLASEENRCLNSTAPRMRSSISGT